MRQDPQQDREQTHEPQRLLVGLQWRWRGQRPGQALQFRKQGQQGATIRGEGAAQLPGHDSSDLGWARNQRAQQLGQGPSGCLEQPIAADLLALAQRVATASVLDWLEQLGGQGRFANAGLATDPDQLQGRAPGSPERSLQNIQHSLPAHQLLSHLLLTRDGQGQAVAHEQGIGGRYQHIGRLMDPPNLQPATSVAGQRWQPGAPGAATQRFR